MIAKSYLQKNLEILDKLFIESTSATKGLFYSKLAILELCGWIEKSMDDILRTCYHRNIKNKKDRKEIDDFIKEKLWV